jgi:hypothetical protein
LLTNSPYFVAVKFSTVAVENFLPLHCEPFFGEAISRLSGQLDRLGIASSQRTLLAMTCNNGFDAGLNSYDWGTFSLAMLLLNKKGAVQKPDSPRRWVSMGLSMASLRKFRNDQLQ